MDSSSMFHHQLMQSLTKIRMLM